ncbi:MAG: protein-glutamate O-methyltransferase CheR [Paracoccaceae bacterium]|nr:protein-glutamate O-methyltransferase CheR [Paracoccaceae bacterium]
MMNNLTSETGIDPDSFKAIAELAYRESGLILAVEKTSMIQSRLRHRLKALSLSNFSEYSTLVCSDSGFDERRHMISALTTNVSHFFREKHHFDILEEQLRSTLLPKLKAGGSVRIWSAGCSNGQEAMSIAMTLLEIEPEIEKLNVKVLATDIDAQVVSFAADACYPERLTSGIPTALSHKYFDQKDSGGERFFCASNSLKSLISYRELNLLNEWPMRQQMDVIFCRNVVIYFDQKTQNKLWPRFRQLLTREGFLFLGHSERIPEPQDAGFQTYGPTTYKPAA